MSPCLASDDWRGTSAGAAAHTGSDEHHLHLVVEDGIDLVEVFLGQILANDRLAARSETGAELNFVGHDGVFEGFLVCVAHQEANPFNSLTVHLPHSVTPTATNTDDLDDLGGMINDGFYQQI